MAARAVHLELISKLDVSSFINGFRRFKARRGHIEELVLDNATNHRGSQRKLAEEIARWNATDLGRRFRQLGTSFRFNTPAASHAGGVFERLIRSCREHLRHLLDQQSLTDEQLNTFIVEVEFVVNSRPLTPVSDDPHDLEALTPNHILQLKPMGSLPPGVFEPDQTYLRNSWKKVQALVNAFWRRWIPEYLPTLSKRTKWTKPQRDLRIGDLVLIHDNLTTRGLWPLARVTRTFPSDDGHVWNVEVKTSTGLYRRPCQKIHLLEASPV